MRRDDAISKIMTTDVETVQVGQRLSQVRRLFVDRPFHHAPVMRDDELVGMLSATDLGRLVLTTYWVDDRAADAMLDSEYSVERVMTTELSTISSRATVREAAEVFINAPFHALPVVDDGELVGIVTTTDVIRHLMS